MAVTEGEDHVRRRGRRADHRQAVGQRRALSHPLARPRGVEPRQQALGQPGQRPRPAPVGRRVEPGELGRTRNPQARLHGRGDEHALGLGHRMAQLDARLGEGDVIAALGLERDLDPDPGGELCRPGAGGDHQPVGRELARRGLQAHRARGLRTEAQDLGLADLAAQALEIFGQDLDQAPRVGGVPLGRDHDPGPVGRVERGLELAELAARERGERGAALLAQAPVGRVEIEALRIARYVDVGGLANELRRPGLLGERLVERDRRAVDREQGIGDGRDARGPAGAQEPDQPGRQARQVPRPDRERPVRVEQPARHLAERAGHGRGHAGPGREHAGVAEGAGLAGRDAVEDRHIEALLAQLERAAHADDAGPDHDRARRGPRGFG